MHNRQRASAVIIAALALAGCASSTVPEVQESAAFGAQAPDIASFTQDLGQYGGEVRFIAGMSETPRQVSVGEQLYVLYFDSRPQSDPLPGDIVAALSRLSSVARTPVTVLGDAEHRLNEEAGGTAVEQISARYGLALSSADGPFLVMLPRHPLDPAAEGDIANVVGFAGLPNDRIAAAISSAASASGPHKGEFTADPTCITYNIFSILITANPFVHSHSTPPPACRQ